jgi:hypothetical protein
MLLDAFVGVAKDGFVARGALGTQRGRHVRILPTALVLDALKS